MTTQVLDEWTKHFLFGGGFGMKSILDKLAGADESFDENPITDMTLINNRLDAIGEFMQDEGIRDIVEKMGDAISRCAGLYNNLERYEEDREYDFMVQHRARDLVNAIRVVAEISELSSILIEAPQTILVQEFAAAYTDTVAKHPHGLGDLLTYVSELHGKLKEAGIEVQDDSVFARPGDKMIDVDELETILDIDEINAHHSALQQAAKLTAVLATYVSLARTAVDNNYCRPEIVAREENCLVIEEGYYLIGGASNLKKSIPNPTSLDGVARVEILEGINSGGKTFDMRKALHIAATALSGCWVPAKYAKVSIRDKIIMRQKGTGDIMSAFQQDCESVVEASPPEGEYWLIALDETFTSTEKRGGAALSYGFVRHILDQGNSLLILSSHYPELSSALVDTPGVAVNHFPFTEKLSEDGTELKFPHVKTPGPMDHYDYAIKVARHLGFDETILELAKQRLNQELAHAK